MLTSQVMNFFLKILLIPVSFLYGLLVFMRNLLFDTGIFSSTQFKIPIIGIGNLTSGGTGKTPHVEYLIKLLKSKYKVATLSRGYGRKTRGFYLATEFSSVGEIGDEPVQYKKKFPDVTVSVCESRVLGVKNLLKQNTPPNVILLDDSFQHRKIKPGLSILLLKYSDIYKSNYMLPLGTLREWPSGKSRADILVVSKCPKNISIEEKEKIKALVNPKSSQEIYFSHINYVNLMHVYKREGLKNLEELSEYTIILFTGIADYTLLYKYLLGITEKVIHLKYADHYNYSLEDMLKIRKTFDQINNHKKIIITTEKDATRLTHFSKEMENFPIYYLPIEISFDDKEKFHQYIMDYLKAKTIF